MWETEYLHNYLEFNNNYDVYGFTLPGHEKTIVKAVKYDEWIDASKEKIDKLITKYKTIYIIGHSMGGVIAAYLASCYKGVKKLVLLAPAFSYGNFDQNKLDLKKRILNNKEYKEKYVEEIYNDLLSKILVVPISSVLEFAKLVKEHNACTENISCPVLIMHGKEDEIIPLETSKDVYDKIKSNDKHLTFINHTKHRILISNKKEEVSEYINCFLKGGLKWKNKKKSEI